MSSTCVEWFACARYSDQVRNRTTMCVLCIQSYTQQYIPTLTNEKQAKCKRRTEIGPGRTKQKRSHTNETP